MDHHRKRGVGRSFRWFGEEHAEQDAVPDAEDQLPHAAGEPDAHVQTYSSSFNHSFTGQLFLDFEKMRVRYSDEVDLVARLVAQVCAPLPGPVDVVVNYDGFRLDEAVESDWARMVAGLTARYYRTVTRYSGSAFMRMKLREVFPDARTHIFESRDQARTFLDSERPKG